MHTGNPELHYETIDARARPARVAVLTDSADSGWRHTTARIIEFLSSVWGGKHSVIIPTDGSTIEPIFWTVLEKFSPDYVFFYQKTWRDIQISDPEKYAVSLESVISPIDRDSVFSDGQKERINQEFGNTPADQFALHTDLCSGIANRLVPFHFERRFEPINGHGYVPSQLTGILDVLTCVDHPQSFTSFHVPAEVDAVWWTAHTGATSAMFSEQLRSVGLNEEKTLVSEETFGGFSDWVAGKFNPARRAAMKAFSCGPEFAPPDLTRPTPFELSMSCTALYGDLISRSAVANRFALVLGDSLADFCLSYCLPRIGHPAVWLPMVWINDLQTMKSTPLQSCVFSAVYAVPSEVRFGSGLTVCSASTDAKAVAEVLEILKRFVGLGLNNGNVNPINPTLVVARANDAPIPYCIDSPNHPEIHPFLGDISVGPIRSPRPTGFSKLNALKHKWVAEVRIGSRPVPTVPFIAQHHIRLNQNAGAHNIRVSQQAYVYACPSSNLQHPEIRLFDTFTAFSMMAEAEGYTCELSDKGIYQRDSLKKLGGISGAAKLFRDHSSRAVFNKFLDHTGVSKGTFDEGCVLHGDKRRYLDLEATKKLMGGDEKSAVALLDKLTAAKVTFRGFVFKCEVCIHAEWYSLGVLTDEFQCTRCGREQTIRHRHWRQPGAPQIFYKLDEIVYQFLKGDGDVVALSLDYMAQTSKHPFDYSPEIKFGNDSFKGEIDICAVWDGVLTIGEAKKNGKLGSSDSDTQKTVQKYVRLAAMLNARRVLFCTTSPEWNSSTIETVERAFDGKLAKPRFLVKTELFGES